MDNIFYIDTENEKAVISSLFGLVIECPMGGNPDNCVFHKIRKLPLEKRFKWIKEMSHSDRVKKILEHRKCIAERENK